MNALGVKSAIDRVVVFGLALGAHRKNSHRGLRTVVGDPTHGLLPAFYFPTSQVVFGIALVTVLGLGSGFLPAWQASRLRIVDALRRN